MNGLLWHSGIGLLTKGPRMAPNLISSFKYASTSRGKSIAEVIFVVTFVTLSHATSVEIKREPKPQEIN